MVDQRPRRPRPFVYRGDNYGGVMTPVFVPVFGAASVFVLVSTLRGDGPPLWFGLTWVSFAMAAVGLTAFGYATKIEVDQSFIRWSYLARRGGSAPVEDIESVGALGWAMPGWVR